MDKRAQAANRVRWLEQVSEWSKSGLSQSAYCRDHGLRANFFRSWIESKVSVEAKPVPTRVPLEVEAVPATNEPGKVDIGLRHKNGWKLRLCGDTPEMWLSSILKQLA